MPADPNRDPYYRLRHSLAHVMAQAVLTLFPEGKVAIGPPKPGSTTNGSHFAYLRIFVSIIRR